ncbi:MAG: aldo/keto reductase [Candidatus Hydrogenedentes bacterium]|nr:aldo/keto reductase [Candidatus Hydrogenedentota bacterium]
MNYAQLGATDLRVSRICFGCWQLSPRFWGDVPLGPWRTAVRRALDFGVNFIDTADAYGDGYAESCLGDYLASEGLRDKFVIATKFYWTFHSAERHPDTRYEYILRACEDSLRRLKTDQIDLYQIHNWDPLTRPDEVAAALGRLKKEGKIRWAGVSNLNVEQMSLYRGVMDIASLQPVYSMIKRDVEARELPYCLQHRIGVLAYSPLYRGLLTGKYAPGASFTDSRADDLLYRGRAFLRMLDAVNELKPLADGLGLTLGQFAIRWVLTHPALTCAIVGVKAPEHIESIVAAADEVLPVEIWYKSAAIIKRGYDEAMKMGL